MNNITPHTGRDNFAKLIEQVQKELAIENGEQLPDISLATDINDDELLEIPAGAAPECEALRIL